VVVVVRLGLVRRAAEIRVKVIPVGALLNGHEMRSLGMLVRRSVVLMLVLMFVRVRMGVIVRMRMHQIAVLMRVFVCVLMSMHMAMLLRMVVIVRHDQPSLAVS
jgi:hypothetical protein